MVIFDVSCATLTRHNFGGVSSGFYRIPNTDVEFSITAPLNRVWFLLGILQLTTVGTVNLGRVPNMRHIVNDPKRCTVRLGFYRYMPAMRSLTLDLVSTGLPLEPDSLDFSSL